MDESEIEGEIDYYPNVVTINKQPYEPPIPTPREITSQKMVDDDAIAILEAILEQFQAGELHGVCLIAGAFDDKGNLINAVTVTSEIVASYAMSFVGAVEDAKQTVLGLLQYSDGEGGVVIDDGLFEIDEEDE